MTPQQLRDRTKRYAIGIMRLCRQLPADWQFRLLGSQLLRAGTAVAANYRASCRARSEKEFCAKIGIVLEEADESQLWLELLSFAGARIDAPEYGLLVKEASELTAIFTASHRTATANLRKRVRARAQH